MHNSKSHSVLYNFIKHGGIDLHKAAILFCTMYVFVLWMLFCATELFPNSWMKAFLWDLSSTRRLFYAKFITETRLIVGWCFLKINQNVAALERHNKAKKKKKQTKPYINRNSGSTSTAITVETAPADTPAWKSRARSLTNKSMCKISNKLR